LPTFNVTLSWALFFFRTLSSWALMDPLFFSHSITRLITPILPHPALTEECDPSAIANGKPLLSNPGAGAFAAATGSAAPAPAAGGGFSFGAAAAPSTRDGFSFGAAAAAAAGGASLGVFSGTSLGAVAGASTPTLTLLVALDEPDDVSFETANTTPP